jgi:acyl-CoA dehydrogenase
MRSIGAAELALEMMVERSIEQKAFGKTTPSARHGARKHRQVAHQNRSGPPARASHGLDDRHRRRQGCAQGNSHDQGARSELYTTVCDRAMQVFGAMGISPDMPLADHWNWGRDGHSLHIQKEAYQ